MEEDHSAATSIPTRRRKKKSWEEFSFPNTNQGERVNANKFASTHKIQLLAGAGGRAIQLHSTFQARRHKRALKKEKYKRIQIEHRGNRGQEDNFFKKETKEYSQFSSMFSEEGPSLLGNSDSFEPVQKLHSRTRWMSCEACAANAAAPPWKEFKTKLVHASKKWNYPSL